MKKLLVNLDSRSFKIIEKTKNEDLFLVGRLERRISYLNSLIATQEELKDSKKFFIIGSDFEELPEYITKSYIFDEYKIISVGANLLFFMHRIGISDIIFVTNEISKTPINIKISNNKVDFYEKEIDTKNIYNNFLKLENSICGEANFSNSGVHCYSNGLERILIGKSGLGEIFYKFNISSIIFEMDKDEKVKINTYCENCNLQCNKSGNLNCSDKDPKITNISDQIGLDSLSLKEYIDVRKLTVEQFYLSFLDYRDDFNKFLKEEKGKKKIVIDNYDEIGFCKFPGDKNFLKTKRILNIE